MSGKGAHVDSDKRGGAVRGKPNHLVLADAWNNRGGDHGVRYTCYLRQLLFRGSKLAEGDRRGR